VARVDSPRLGTPGLGPRIRCVDGDVHDLRNLHTPLADDGEAFAVPVGVGDQVDRDLDAERTGELQGLEGVAERDPLAVLAQALLVDRIETEVRVLLTQASPHPDNVLVETAP